MSDGIHERRHCMIRVRWAWPVVLLVSALAVAAGSSLGHEQSDSANQHADLDRDGLRTTTTENDEDA